MKPSKDSSPTCYRDTTLGIALTETLRQLTNNSSLAAQSSSTTASSSTSPSSSPSLPATAPRLSASQRDFILSEFDRAFEHAFAHVNELQSCGAVDFRSRAIQPHFAPSSSTLSPNVQHKQSGKSRQEDKHATGRGDKFEAFLRGKLDKYAVCGATTKIQLSQALFTSERTGALQVEDHLLLDLRSRRESKGHGKAGGRQAGRSAG